MTSRRHELKLIRVRVRMLTRHASCLTVALLAAGVIHAQERPAVGDPPPAPEERFLMDPPGIEVHEVATGLEAVWDLAFTPDGRLLIAERPGRIRVVTPDGTLQPDPWAALDRVFHGGGGGLMGMALHPAFAREPWVYVIYTAIKDGGFVNRVSRFRDAGRQARDEEVVLDGLPAATTHNGGRLAFGPDGMLYVTIGDTGQRAQAQNLNDLRGSLLRVTPDGRVPDDNPWPGNPIWATGLRNVHGLAFQPGTGALFAADHGPSGEWTDPLIAARDELNVVVRGRNYGWPRAVGAPGVEGLEDPLLVWDPAAPPGGLAFLGPDAGPLAGDLFLATLRSEALIRIRFGDASAPTRVTGIERWFVAEDLGEAEYGAGPSRYGRLRAVVAGPDGALYVGTSNRDRGRGTIRDGDDKVLRIVPVRE